MKLLFAHQHLGAFGGAEANIQLTADELKRRGHTSVLLYQQGTGRSEESWRKTFTECVRLPGKGRAAAIAAAIAQVEPDLIYLHKLADLEVVEALLASGTPVVRMVHDHEMYCLRGYKYNYLTRRVCARPTSLHCVFPCLAFVARDRESRLGLKWASYSAKRKEIQLNQRCARLVVYSEYSRQELVRNGFDNRKIAIHVPIRGAVADMPASSFSDRNLILYVGQIIRGKGVDVLLRALAKVKTPFECLIIGDGHHRARCERLCRRLGLAGRVHFLGFVPRDELMNYYLDASLLAVSSLWPEPFGMVGPEAMRYGLPVVAFDAGGIREWLSDGENGFLVPWKDTARFAARVEDLLHDKDLARRMGQHGRERVNHDFEATRQVDNLEELFLKVVRESEDGNGAVSNLWPITTSCI